uniref:DUF4460 domain-containing protein n=1 Tax=Graphocephala atropunctata TaxID=36148 RepID=A0A1B6M2B5_9HEMI
MATEIICRRIKLWLKPDVWNQGNVGVICRYLTSGEVSTALRPFYFTVHPDLFGQFPQERAVNENSLKTLSSILESLQENKPQRPTTLRFYLKPQGVVVNRESLKSVNISLVKPDIRETVTVILTSCNLPTTYVDNIAPTPVYKYDPSYRSKVYRYTQEPSTNYNEYDYTYNSRIKRPERKTKPPKEFQSLRSWLEDNESEAREKLAAVAPVREEVTKLQESLCQQLGLAELAFDCGWNIAHFRGCLQSFQSLANQHPDQMAVLKGRSLVFSNDTGVSMKGQVLLNSGEVRHNWLDFIKKLHKEEEVLLTVPAFEKATSRVLKDIRVVRRKFQPKTMAKEYEKNLRRLTTSLSDYQGRRGFPKHWPESLANYELVVETEAGPLMVSPTGQFIVPASCPSFLLVTFISENLDNAAKLLHHYRAHKHIEKELHAQCVSELELAALQKDDSVTPDLMTACLRRLLDHRQQLAMHLRHARLNITNYYSVMSDGQMCIPWNFKL